MKKKENISKLYLAMDGELIDGAFVPNNKFVIVSDNKENDGYYNIFTNEVVETVVSTFKRNGKCIQLIRFLSDFFIEKKTTIDILKDFLEDINKDLKNDLENDDLLYLRNLYFARTCKEIKGFFKYDDKTICIENTKDGKYKNVLTGDIYPNYLDTNGDVDSIYDVINFIYLCNDENMYGFTKIDNVITELTIENDHNVYRFSHYRRFNQNHEGSAKIYEFKKR